MADDACVTDAPVLKTDDSVVHFGKPKEAFRVYGSGSNREDKVTRHYTLMRSKQTVAFVRAMEEKVSPPRASLRCSTQLLCERGLQLPVPLRCCGAILMPAVGCATSVVLRFSASR
jgi:hypothetical protein